MTQMLGLLKITTINVLRALMEKVNNIQKQMGNAGREMKPLKKKSKGNVRDQNHCNINEDCL